MNYEKYYINFDNYLKISNIICIKKLSHASVDSDLRIFRPIMTKIILTTVFDRWISNFQLLIDLK